MQCVYGKLNQNYIASIAKKLNNTPRKVLNYMTPLEVFKAHSSYRFVVLQTLNELHSPITYRNRMCQRLVLKFNKLPWI